MSETAPEETTAPDPDQGVAGDDVGEGGKRVADMSPDEKIEWQQQKIRRLEDKVRGKSQDPNSDVRALRKQLRDKDSELVRLSERASMLDALEESTKTETEKERDRLKAELDAARVAQDEQRRTFGAQLVNTKLSAAAPAKGMTPDALNTLAGDPSRFLADGGVDDDALDAFLSALPDAAKREVALTPGSLGGGRRTEVKASGLSAGAALYEQMHKKRSPA